MKLIYCKKCGDIIKLGMEKDSSTCQCGASGGYYLKDGLHAEIWGDAIPLGIDNNSFESALLRRNLLDDIAGGVFFDAFVIPKICDTVTKRRKKRPK
jgi:hypothetical protein